MRIVKSIAMMLLMVGSIVTLTPSCNIPDPADFNTLLEEAKNLQPDTRGNIVEQSYRMTAKNYLKKQKDFEPLGYSVCYKRPLNDNNEGEWKEFEGRSIDKQTTAFVIEALKCLAEGITDEHFGAAPLVLPHPAYGDCLGILMRKAAKREATVLMELGESNDPFDYYLPSGEDLRGMQIRCQWRPYQTFDPEVVYGNERPLYGPDTPRPPLAGPDLGGEDYDEDIEDQKAYDEAEKEWANQVRWETLRMALAIMLRLDNPPPVIEAALAGAASDTGLEAFITVICTLDAGPNWGCAGAPGLPGYGDGIVIKPDPNGGDNP